jgi:hypothetical protein
MFVFGGERSAGTFNQMEAYAAGSRSLPFLLRTNASGHKKNLMMLPLTDR